MLFGKSRAQQMYEQSLETLKSRKTKKARTQKKRLMQDASDHITSILDTNNGQFWTGEIYFARKTRLDLVFDTGSDWLVVEGVDCEECEGNTYDPSTSTYSS